MKEKLDLVSKLFCINKQFVYSENNKFLAKTNIPVIEKYCIANNISTELKGDFLLLKIKSFLGDINLVCFDDIERYFDSCFVNKNFAIVDNVGNYCFKTNDSSEIVWSENVEGYFETTCKNLFSYYQLYNFFKSSEFSDHHNDANAEIVIYSSVNGIFKITYKHVPEIEKGNDYSANILSLIDLAQPLQVRVFFKNALFTFSEGKGTLCINEIIRKSAEIIDTTKRNFEIASKQFDFEKFRDSLYKEKEKYFSNSREIVNKIFSQALGIPISITATVFSTYKVSDDAILLLIVLLAFVVYVLFYIKIQLIYKADLKELHKEFIRDFEIIKSKSGLPEIAINVEKIKIENKIKLSISVVKWLIVIIVCLGFLVGMYVIYQIGKYQIVSIIESIFYKVFFC